MPTTQTTEAPPKGICSDVQISSHSPTLLVLRATVAMPFGRQELALAMPAAPLGSAPWQAAILALFIGQVRQGAAEPTGKGLRDFLTAQSPRPTPLRSYPYEALHEARVTCILDLALGERDKSGWPSASLVVIEREEGRTPRCGFRPRVRDFHSARDIIEEALDDISGERDRLLALARRRPSPRLLELARAASTLSDQVEAVWKQLKADVQHRQAGRARAAMRGLAVEPDRRETVMVPRATPLIVTGTLSAPPRQIEVEGRTVTRLQVQPDEEFYRDGSPMPQLLICSLAGEIGAKALRLGVQPGQRVAVRGRLRTHHYRHADGIPRSAVSLEADGFGPFIG